MADFNLRVHLHGVQGSGSVFPSRAEREAQRQHDEVRLLSQVLAHLDEQGRAGVSVADAVGGLDKRAIAAFRERFDIPESRVYGGWTTCVRVETGDGKDLVFDCGSGFRVAAKELAGKWASVQGPRDLWLFGTHSHFDHTEGFEQAAVCFDPRNRIHVLAERQFLRSLDQNLGIFSHEVAVNLKGVQTPLSYELMPASFDSTEIRDFAQDPPPSEPDPLVGAYHDLAEPLVLGQTTVRALAVFHPSPCLAYKVEHGGKSFVFCTDHELRHGEDPEDPRQIASEDAERRLRAWCQGVDLLYRDGQYFRVEYDGYQGIGSPHGVPRLDWGHSCVEDVIEMAIECGVQRTLIGHHDPNRDWSERNWIDETLARRSEQAGLSFELARAETVIEL